jgi:HEAT repeat protein
VREKVLPALRALAEDRRIDPDIQASAVIALGRCGDLRDVLLLFRIAKNESGFDPMVEESAALALGLLQVRLPEVREVLVDILSNRGARTRTRCFAALALGLIGESSKPVREALVRTLDGRESGKDLPVCALAAIGLLGDREMVPDLLKWLDEGRIRGERLSDFMRSHVISALGRIEDPAALPALARLLRRKGTQSRRAACIAMGQVLPHAGEEARLAYLRGFTVHLGSEKDVVARNFGAISLGRIGAAPGVPEGARKICVDTLLARFRKGKARERTYVALALGLIGLDRSEMSATYVELKAFLADGLRTALDRGRGERNALGAYAIALGMLGDVKSVRRLTLVLEDEGKDATLRASAAAALGLIGHHSALESILATLTGERDREIRMSCAASAALLGGAQALPALVEVLSDARQSQFVLGSTLLALGRLGDVRAVEPILEIVEPGKRKGRHADLVRSMAVVALGQIGARSDVRVLARISRDVNYHALVPALEEALSIY